jgi:hypothetical protein
MVKEAERDRTALSEPRQGNGNASAGTGDETFPPRRPLWGATPFPHLDLREEFRDNLSL